MSLETLKIRPGNHQTEPIPVLGMKYTDGGRHKYFKGEAGDCVCRALAIATGRDYKEVYDILSIGNSKYSGKKSARNGVGIKRKWFKDLMLDWGFEWVSCMGIGTGCIVHLRKDELPDGIIICRLSKHVTCVIDGVIHDTYDPSRKGTRCVYGYWKKIQS